MPVLAVPGPLAPAPPLVTLEVPEAWEAVPAGWDLLHVRGTGSAGDPVDVRLRSHTGPVECGAADLLDDAAASVPEGSEVEPAFLVEIGGREWTARNVSWDEPSGPVVEVHLAVAVDRPTGQSEQNGQNGHSEENGQAGPAGERPLARLLLATGRVRGDALDADYDLLRSVLETLVVGGGS